MAEWFGDFEILRSLGAGGMAETFVARRVREGGFVKVVALKRVLPGRGDDPEFVRMFQREARLAARLEHPHVASVYDFGCTDGRWWMAVELVEGVDLRQLLVDLRERGERLPLPLVVLIAADVASALAYAWARVIDAEPARIVHRDVTPSNVLLGYHGAVKLADFGVAKAALEGEATRTGGVYGKVPYMAPEQALGQSIDHRVDLFALGVTMFEMLAGERPFDGATELDTLQRITLGRRRDLRELAPEVPAALARAIDELLIPARDGRTESAERLLEALGPFAPGVDARSRLAELVRRAKPPESIAALPPVSVRPAAELATPSEPQQLVPTRTRQEGVIAGRPVAPAVEVPVRPRAQLAIRVAVAVALAITLAALSAAAWSTLRPAGAPIATPAERAEAPSVGSVAVEQDPIIDEPEEMLASPSQDAGSIAASSSAAEVAEQITPPADAVGRVTVSVYPWGYVWIDGRSRGRAPVRATLAAGVHVIGAGPSAARPTARRRVEIGAGGTETVSIDLQ